MCNFVPGGTENEQRYFPLWLAFASLKSNTRNFLGLHVCCSESLSDVTHPVQLTLPGAGASGQFTWGTEPGPGKAPKNWLDFGEACWLWVSAVITGYVFLPTPSDSSHFDDACPQAVGQT